MASSTSQAKNKTKLKKLKQFVKSIKSKVIKSKKINAESQINDKKQENPLKYSHSDSSFLITSIKPLKQARPVFSGSELESEYEEMSSDYCTLPRKKMKYRIKQKVFKKSLDAILLEARKEIIEESSSDESDDTYVACNQDNTYEELHFPGTLLHEESIYEEI